MDWNLTPPMGGPLVTTAHLTIGLSFVLLMLACLSAWELAARRRSRRSHRSDQR